MPGKAPTALAPIQFKGHLSSILLAKDKTQVPEMKELREMLRRQTGICEDPEGVRVLAWMVTTGEVGPRCSSAHPAFWAENFEIRTLVHRYNRS